MRPSTLDQTIEENAKLVYYIYERLPKCQMTITNRDDLISEGLIGLFKAAQRYDHARGARFSTFAATCIRNQMRMYIRRLNKEPEGISLNAPIGVDADGNDLCLADVIEDHAHGEKWMMERINVREFIEKQTPQDQMILTAQMNGYTQREIGAQIGMPRGTVARHVKNLQAKARLWN